MGFLISNPTSNYTKTFWSCFRKALDDNQKNRDGKCRILSIIANDFTYKELENNLDVATHTIGESRKHAMVNGFGCPPLVKPIFYRLKFTMEQINQFEYFFTRKDVVNMSSHKNYSQSGLPIMYLQDHKQALWEKFSEEYPNGIHHTAFMTCLQGSRYVFQNNLGGLCSECNECGYEVFASIDTIIGTHIGDESLKISQAIKQYVKLGNTIENDDDIEIAINEIVGTKFANLLPNQNQGEDISFIYARILPEIGEWKKWSSTQIEKIQKE
ncbi:3254_t:CDS:2 [Diversispora eburnea]|uniref:3254_t:CDS:1 n=1 Tax=Diversispora eburnea TaxID=1213867 RepID=A0A9N8V4D1_9GLOM|nr:3254_t:CDS:2 [Diversispora eburnea]